MKNSLEIEVFRVGDYGPKGTYTTEDLRQIAADYDPAWHEAPVTLDHRQDGPAYGWVDGLRCAGEVLLARLKDLHESLVEWVRTGAYKKRSIELYRAFARTGRPYLRALSFLGACPPEVKGLADPVFREDGGERVVVEFDTGAAAPDGRQTAAFVEADETGVDSSDESAADAFAELESLRSKAAHLEADLASERTQRRRAELTRFCEEGRQAGRILPAWEAAGLVEFMMVLDVADAQIATPDGRQVSLAEWFQRFLQGLGPQIDLAEAAPAQSVREAKPLALPRPMERATIRPETLSLHERAVAFCREHEDATYVEALQAVARL